MQTCVDAEILRNSGFCVRRRQLAFKVWYHNKFKMSKDTPILFFYTIQGTTCKMYALIKRAKTYPNLPGSFQWCMEFFESGLSANGDEQAFKEQASWNGRCVLVNEADIYGWQMQGEEAFLSLLWSPWRQRHVPHVADGNDRCSICKYNESRNLFCHRRVNDRKIISTTAELCHLLVQEHQRVESNDASTLLITLLGTPTKMGSQYGA